MSSTEAGQVKWAHPGALGLMCFGFNTILLQIHNIGLIKGDIPILYAFFWGGLAQVVCGIIDARRGDTFGFTAFTAYGFFWIGLAFLHFFGYTKDSAGLAWAMLLWGLFTLYMTFPATKVSVTHTIIFASLTVLFFLLAGAFFGFLPVQVAGWEGLICGGSAVYGSAAVIFNDKYGRWVLPLGLPK